MAFHVACPITCQRICFCTLGFPEQLQSERGRSDFLEEVCRIEGFLADPWALRSGGKNTVDVLVPRIGTFDGFGKRLGDLGGGDGGDSEELLSTQTKRAAMQRRAAAASMAAEDYARRFESGDLTEISGEASKAFAGEDQVLSAVKVMCRICFSGENEGSDRASRMLSCQSCSKKYHRICLKSWAEYRDLFDWSSWVCASCRTCEVCRRAGDPTKFMFCKRCDGAYHSYCQQPPHKNVTPGPYLCPKHTRCHSCGSTVPGSGLSTRWFLGYTCCDACGRLFVKGKYCPVCLKVYRDSESTPMVCCDACQRWVHCQCDGISDEKYQQFQTDRNLYYKCAACRGDCYQVSDLDDAVQELWKRRDDAEQGQIANLRAAAGLPPKDGTFPFSPYSDDEHRSIIFKSENGKSLRLCVKGSLDKSTKNTKEYGKKPSKKNAKKKGFKNLWNAKTEEPFESFERFHETPSLENSLGDEKIDDTRSYRTGAPETFLRSPSNNKEKSSITKFGITSKNFTGDLVNNDNGSAKIVQIKNSKAETVKGKKLVIHFASRNRNLTNSPMSEASSCHREQDSAASMGSDDNKQQFANPREKHPFEAQDETARLDDGKGFKVYNADQLKISKHRGKESSLMQLGKVKSEDSVLATSKVSMDKIAAEYELNVVERISVLPGKRNTAGLAPIKEAESTLKNEQGLLRKHSKCIMDPLVSATDETFAPSVSDSLSRDSKPLLKLKFKNPYVDNRSSWVPQVEDDKNFVKGQRSKRKRPSPVVEREQSREENEAPLDRGNLINEMDANWILKKLGKDAIGKRVEVHQASDDSWHKGVVKGVIGGTSSLTILLDDGSETTLELGKQGVRFVSQKQKRART